MISVIIPVYNVEPYLKKCLDSVVGQTYKDLEILIIDDGSTDGSGKICDEYAVDQRVRVFHTENQGVSAARNKGIEEAKGEYLAFVDSDDWLEPNMYEVLLNKTKETDADISICGFWFDATSASKAYRPTETIYHGTEALEALMAKKITSHSVNKLYKKELFDQVRFPLRKAFEDTLTLYVVIGKANTVAMMPDPGYHYWQRPGSITKSYTAKNLIDGANAYLVRYQDVKDQLDLNQDVLLLSVAENIVKVWRWWYGCGKDEKKQYKEQIKELKTFSKKNLPMFGYRSWPKYLRLSIPFTHSSCGASFAILYLFNYLCRRIRYLKGNEMARVFSME